MKSFPRLVAAFFVFAFATFSRAGDFNSMVMQANQVLQITVPGDRFLVIRNFTQEVGGSSRGFVSVTSSGSTASDVFTATIVDPAAPPGFLEVINNIVIAGPAAVTVTCGDTTSCFITYRKGTE